MAKKNSEAAGGIDIFKTLQKIDNSVEIIEDSAFSNIKEWIPTGNYILNACISGDLFKGIPSGRVTSLAGESQTGKSYLACSICREAQKLGYTVVYLDSEAGMDKDFAARLGCDTSRFLIKQVNTIRETSEFIANMCKDLQEQVDAGAECPKIIMVIDSLSQLTSDKERNDTMTGNTAADFTKAKDIKALFRVNTIPLSKLNIVTICVNHVYANIGSFMGGTVMAGGSGIAYSGSVTLKLTAAKLVDKANDQAANKKVGSETVKKNGVLISATPDKSRFSIPRKVKFQIPFFQKPNPYVGLEEYLNWDNAGIMMGKCITEAEYLKLKPAEQLECNPYRFEHPEKGVMYAWPKKALTKGVGMVCRHLGETVPVLEFWSSKVFTDEFLHKINDEIIKPLFELPKQGSFDDLKELEEDLMADDETEGDNNA